jgi:hypothetical protein
MRRAILAALLLAVSVPFLMAGPRVVIDVGPGAQAAPSDTAQRAVLYAPVMDSTAPRLVIDPSQLAIQFSLDSVMTSAEGKIRNLVLQLEGAEGDTGVERRIGELVGQVLIERELALLDLQILYAEKTSDTLLLSGLRLALEELLRQNPQLQEMLLREVYR